MTKYRLRAPAFRLPRTGYAAFLSEQRVVCLGSGGSVFNTESRKKTHNVNTCSNPSTVAISDTGDWIATKNQSGEIVTSRLSDGSLLSKYKRPPYQDSGQLARCDDHSFLDSTNGVVHIHSIESGSIFDTYKYGDKGWMTAGVAYSKSLNQIIVGVRPRLSKLLEPHDSLIHFFDFYKCSQPVKSLKLPPNLESMSLSPDETKIVLMFNKRKSENFEIQVISTKGELLARTDIECSLGKSTWTPDSKQLAVILDHGCLTLLDALTLDIKKKYFGPALTGITFESENDLIALSSWSGFGGIVLPSKELSNWSDYEGSVRYQQLRNQYYAYSLQVDLRKYSPPRIALFIKEDDILFESERLVGLFRYVPNKVIATEKKTSSSEILGATLRRALADFEDSETAREWTLGPGFPDEKKYLLESNISENRLDTVRYLGHDIPYNIDHSDIEIMITVVSFEDRLHFWLCQQTDKGSFYENDWPHYHVSSNMSDEELGKTLLTAIKKLAESPKLV